jgi:hypothetical protein
MTFGDRCTTKHGWLWKLNGTLFDAGHEKGAGTDADITVRLMGLLDRSCSTQHPLIGSREAFERSRTDVFTLESEDLGPLTALEVSRTSTGHSHGWLCEQVVVTDLAAEQRYVFAVDSWLDDEHGCSKVIKPIDGASTHASYTVNAIVPSSFSSAG